MAAIENGQSSGGESLQDQGPRYAAVLSRLVASGEDICHLINELIVVWQLLQRLAGEGSPATGAQAHERDLRLNRQNFHVNGSGKHVTLAGHRGFPQPTFVTT